MADVVLEAQEVQRVACDFERSLSKKGGCGPVNEREHVLNAALLAIGLGVLMEPTLDVQTAVTIGLLFVPIVLGALFPDVDAHYGEHRKALHNLFVLGIIAAYPLVANNLHWVWLGVLTHYVLDVLGTVRGIALFYPLSDREFEIPVGVPASSWWAGPVTIGVTALELGIISGVSWLLAAGLLPPLPVL